MVLPVKAPTPGPTPGDVEGLDTRLLDAAESLFYARGIQAVGMDEIRGATGISLKRLYQRYPSKEQLVVAMLERRDVRWRGRLAASVAEVDDPRERVLAVFDWLGRWFAEPGFRGCAWINAAGELAPTWPSIAEQARRHKSSFAQLLADLVAEAGLDGEPTLAPALLLLAEGAMVTAGIFATSAPAAQARAAAAILIRSADTSDPDLRCTNEKGNR